MCAVHTKGPIPNKAKSANQLPSNYCIGKSRSAKVAPAKVTPAKVAPAKVASCSAKVTSCPAKVARQKLQKVVSVQKFSKQTKVIQRREEGEGEEEEVTALST